MGEEVCAFIRLELVEGVRCGGFEGVEGSGGGVAHMRFELSEGVFDGVEVGTVGRQVEELGALGLDRLPEAGDFVGRQIVHDDDVAGPPGRRL